MEKIIDRISKLAENEGVSLNSLEKTLGASQGVLSRAIRNRTDIHAEWLSVLVENYPHYSALWLLTGKGRMRNSERQGSAPASTYDIHHNGQVTINDLAEKLSGISAELAAMREERQRFLTIIDNLTKK